MEDCRLAFLALLFSDDNSLLWHPKGEKRNIYESGYIKQRPNNVRVRKLNFIIYFRNKNISVDARSWEIKKTPLSFVLPRRTAPVDTS